MEEASEEIIKARAFVRRLRIRQDSEELRTLQSLLDRALVALTPRKPAL